MCVYMYMCLYVHVCVCVFIVCVCDVFSVFQDTCSNSSVFLSISVFKGGDPKAAGTQWATWLVVYCTFLFPRALSNDVSSHNLLGLTWLCEEHSLH